MSPRLPAPRAARIAGAAGLSLLLVTACGGSSGGSSKAADTTPSPSASSSSAAANQPADPAKATAEITANWEEFFAPTTPEATAQSLLQNADKLQQALAIAAKAKASGNKTRAKVKGVTFTSPTEATVTYDLLVNGAVALAGSTGKAVLEGGTWKVSQVTFCTLVALSANGQPVPGC